MKILLLLVTTFSLTLANEVFDQGVENLKFELDRTFAKNFLATYEKGQNDPIVAVVNEYIDQVFKNIGVYAVDNNIDPLNLPDVDEEFLASSIKLTEGKLNGVATIERSDDVTVSYLSSGKILEVHFPIAFSDLSFTYDYHVIILLIGPKGSITGDIEDLQMNIRLQFDFNTYHAAVVGIETSNKGHVTLKFHGNSVVDAVVNVLTEFVTTILHPLIGTIIEDLVTDVIENIVETVNNAIDSILYPDTPATTVSYFIEEEIEKVYNIL